MNLARPPRLVALVGRKKNVVRHQLFSQKPPDSRLWFSRTGGFSPPLARRRSSCPPPSPNLVRTHPIEHYQALRVSPPCLSRVATPPDGHQIGARKRRAPENTILSKPYRHRVSIDRLNHEGSQSAASLEGETGPTPTGKTLPQCVCVCMCFLPIHSGHQIRWTYQPGSHRRKVTQQEEGHIGFFIHVPSAVRALIILARRIQPLLSLVGREVEFCVLTI